MVQEVQRHSEVFNQPHVRSNFNNCLTAINSKVSMTGVTVIELQQQGTRNKTYFACSAAMLLRTYLQTVHLLPLFLHLLKVPGADTV